METLNLLPSLTLTNTPRLALRDEGPNGVLNVNKPFGWTSHDVVRHLRGVLGIQKIGHAGTLDPAATGVLPILVGKGTKIAQYLMDWDKEYVAVLRLGQRTDTEDATGTILQEIPVKGLSETQIRSTVARFQGTIQQVPPMYSAVKVAGQPLYKLASKGKVVERQASNGRDRASGSLRHPRSRSRFTSRLLERHVCAHPMCGYWGTIACRRPFAMAGTQTCGDLAY